MATRFDVLDYCAGDALSLTINVEDDCGNVLDITGATISWTLTQLNGFILGSSALLTKSVSSGITITDATNGALIVSITNSDAIAPGVYIQKLHVASGSTSYTYEVGTFLAR